MVRKLPLSMKMSRRQFESLIKGAWERKRWPSGQAYRQNGDFKTCVRTVRLDNGNFAKRKEITDGVSTIRAKTWRELAIALELI